MILSRTEFSILLSVEIIATFHLGRLSSGGEAIAIISTDNKIENSVLESIKKIPLVIQAKYIQFKDKENE